MKKLIFAILISLSAFASVDEPIRTLSSTIGDLDSIPSYQPAPETKVSKQGYYYVRFSAAESDFQRFGTILPGLGLGYRRLAGSGAADLSFSGIGRKEKQNDRFFWTFPKASYIHYLSPDNAKTAYIGGGMAWGGVDSKKGHFVGIIPNAVVGYEFAHKTAFLTFAEFNLSQPAISVYRKGGFPTPIAELSAGVGF